MELDEGDAQTGHAVSTRMHCMASSRFQAEVDEVLVDFAIPTPCDGEVVRSLAEREVRWKSIGASGGAEGSGRTPSA